MRNFEGHSDPGIWFFFKSKLIERIKTFEGMYRLSTLAFHVVTMRGISL